MLWKVAVGFIIWIRSVRRLAPKPKYWNVEDIFNSGVIDEKRGTETCRDSKTEALYKWRKASIDYSWNASDVTMWESVKSFHNVLICYGHRVHYGLSLEMDIFSIGLGSCSWNLVSVRTFGVMNDHNLFLCCKSDQVGISQATNKTDS